MSLSLFKSTRAPALVSCSLHLNHPTWLVTKYRSTPDRRHVHLSADSIEEWCSTERRIELRDTVSQDRLADLHISLPTLVPHQNGSLASPIASGITSAAASKRIIPKAQTPLQYGHHITFCHPRYPVEQINPINGTENDFEPPPPFARRMWVGGKWTWPAGSQVLQTGSGCSDLLVGKDVIMKSYVGRERVSLKGFDGENPMIFVNQRMEFTHPEYNSGPAREAGVVEERRHVYMLPQKEATGDAGVKRSPRAVNDLPTSSEFSFSYTPTPIHLFRFSALIFNAHYIHLDRVYAKKAGYDDLLIHGPLTALMLLEAFKAHRPDLELRSFEYRAHNPMLVDRQVTVHGLTDSGPGAMQSEAADSGLKKARVWCQTEDGVVGMSAWIEYY